MRTRLRELLSSSDLSPREIAIYLQLLTVRKVTVAHLQARTKLPLPTVYRLLEKLRERGLVKKTPLNGRQCLYAPLSLAALVRKIDTEQQKLRQLELELQSLDGLLPYVEMTEDAQEADILVRYGQEAFKEEYLKMPEVLEEEYLHIGNMANMWKTAGFGYESAEERAFITKRLRRNIYARVLDVPTKEAEEVQKNDSREKRTLVLSASLPIMDDFLLIGEKQVSHFICNPEHPRVIVIRHPGLVALHRSHFESLWKQPTFSAS